VFSRPSQKLPKLLTVAWAVEAVAQGYLEHRRKTPGIQVLWRGWLKLASMSEGWLLAGQVKSDKQIKSLLKF